MDRLLEFGLRKLVHRGSVRVTSARGNIFWLGDGTGKKVAVRFTSSRDELGVVLDPELRLGEAYMDGGLILEEGSIADLLKIAMSQDASAGVPLSAKTL